MRRIRFEYALLPALLAALAAGCGSEAGSSSEVTFESWRTSACAVLRSGVESELAKVPPLPDDSGAFDAFMRRGAEALRETAADLRAIPLPDDRRQQAERFVELSVDMADTYAAALPRIEAASRRWEEVLETIDPATMEPKKEGETVVGSIMTQLHEVPAAREAMEELERAQNAGLSAASQREAERLIAELGLEDCGAVP